MSKCPEGPEQGVYLGLVHHYGWAIAVVADHQHKVIDRRRIELIDRDLPAAPIHHEGGGHELHRSGPTLSDDALQGLVNDVKASVARTAASELDALELTLEDPISSIAVRGWPADFPSEIATLRRAPYESRADSVMYCQILAKIGSERGWQLHTFDAKTVEREAKLILGDRADEVLKQPRKVLGPPWNKDHRTALSAAVVASHRANTTS